MENSKLFQVSEQGYNCSQVDSYIASIKTEYKKLYEYSRGFDAKIKEKDSEISALKEENARLAENFEKCKQAAANVEAAYNKAKEEALAAGNKAEELEKKLASLSQNADSPASKAEDEPVPAPAAAPAQEEKSAPAPSAEHDALLKSLSVMQLLSEEVVRENSELRAKLDAIKAGL